MRRQGPLPSVRCSVVSARGEWELGMRFLHLSDVHVTQNYVSTPLRKLGWRRAVAMWELTIGGRQKLYAQSRRTIERILEDGVRHQVDHVIVSGDLTAYATRWEFEQA